MPQLAPVKLLGWMEWNIIQISEDTLKDEKSKSEPKKYMERNVSFWMFLKLESTILNSIKLN